MAMVKDFNTTFMSLVLTDLVPQCTDVMTDKQALQYLVVLKKSKRI